MCRTRWWGFREGWGDACANTPPFPDQLLRFISGPEIKAAMLTDSKDSDARRFACTSCGKCCDLGPEMELSEATALADCFVTSVIFKAHSIPLSERSERALQWWREQGSRIPLRAAFQERRRHLAQFASRRRSERHNGREVYLTISAAVDDYGDSGCPALRQGLCSIYERRPLTCRTVPAHYSRQPSVLQSYIDKFIATPGYECNATSSPVILRGSNIVSPEIRNYRDRAIEVSKADRRWKEHMLSLMDDAEAARRIGLPTYETILGNTDRGYATLLPMIVAWRIAEHRGLISPDELKDICGKQLTLMQKEISRSPSAQNLRELLPLYEAGAAGRGRLDPAGRLIGSRTA